MVMVALGDWLTTQEAADLAGYHLEYIRRLIREGEIDAQKWGRISWMVSRESLLQYLAKMEEQGGKRGPKAKNG